MKHLFKKFTGVAILFAILLIPATEVDVRAQEERRCPVEYTLGKGYFNVEMRVFICPSTYKIEDCCYPTNQDENAGN